MVCTWLAEYQCFHYDDVNKGTRAWQLSKGLMIPLSTLTRPPSSRDLKKVVTCFETANANSVCVFAQGNELAKDRDDNESGITLTTAQRETQKRQGEGEIYLQKIREWA